MKKLLFISIISAHLGVSVSLADSLNRNAIELSPTQMDSVVAGVGTTVDVGGSGNANLAGLSISDTFSVANTYTAASAGYAAVINPGGGTSNTHASATASDNIIFEMNPHFSNAFGEVRGVAIISHN